MNSINDIYCEAQGNACAPQHYTIGNNYMKFREVYMTHGILCDMLQEIDEDDLLLCITFLTNERTPLWVIRLLLEARETNSKSSNVKTPPFVDDFCNDIIEIISKPTITWVPQCAETSSLDYGLFEENSEDMYGIFLPTLSKEHASQCQCGFDICDIHPSNRTTGLFDPEDYSEDGTYNPNFDFDSDFESYDYSRKEYVARFEYTLNIFGDKVISRSKFKPQAGFEDVYNYFQNVSEADVSGVNLAVHSALSRMDMKYVLKLIEDVLTFAKLSSENVEGMTRFQTVARAVNIFLRLRYPESTFEIYKNRIIPYFLEIWGSYTPQSGDFFETSRGFLNSYKNICGSEISTKMYRCVMFLLSFSLFEKLGISMDTMGYTKLEQAALQKKYYKKSDFIFVLADTLLFILERGFQVYKTGDITTIFHSGGTYKEIYDTCRELKRKEPLLNNPEEHGFTESEFRGQLDNVIEKLESVSKHSMGLDKNDIIIIRNTLNDMLIMRDDLNTHSAARKDRKAPFGLLVYGDSGIGKTTITNILCTYFAKHEHLPLGAEFRYTKNPAAKFWDGFTSSCHTIILDDVANESPDLKDPKSLDEVIQVINNASFCPDQAALDKKGRTPMRAKLVVATTNVKDLNAYHLFARPSAIQRRFPYIITPTVKDEYKDERGMLNSENVPDLGPYPELWNFKVEIVRPVPVDEGKRLAKMEIVHEKLSLKGLLCWMNVTLIKFNKDQTKVRESVEAMKDVELCLVCSLPDVLCDCNVQSGTAISNVMILCMLYMIYRWRDIEKLRQLYKLRNRYNQCAQTLKYYSENLVMNLSDSNYWIDMGNRMARKLKHPKILLTLVGTLGGVYGLYKMFNKCEPQSGTDVGTRPADELEKKENVWYNNDIDLCPANFSRESSSSKSMEFTDFCKKISSNVIHIATVMESGGKVRFGKAICLGGHIYLTNNHNIPDITCTYMDIIRTSKNGVGSNMRVVLTPSDIHRIPGKDLAFLILREIPPGKKITQFFKLGDTNGVFNGAYVTRQMDGSVKYRTVKNVKKSQEKRLKFNGLDIDSSNSLWGGIVSDFTGDGDCGSPLIIQSAYGYSIVGLHFLARTSDGSKVFAADVDGDFITEVYNNLSHYSISSGDFHMINSESTNRKVGDLHKKSVFRYLPEGNANVYGSFMDFRGKSASRVEETPMAPVLKTQGYEVKFTKPEMKSWVPWHIGAADLVKPIHELDTSILNECVESYVSNVTSKVQCKEIREIMMVLDDFTAINGANVTYIDKINRNTSAGNPWKKSKKYFIKSITPQHGMQDPVEVDDEIMDRVSEMIEIYKSGKCVHPNFCAHLKDEPVSFKKAKIGKTRVFTGASFDWSIVVRKYLLSFTRLLQNNRMAFEAGPGTIAQSLEWQEMYDYVVKHGLDRIVAGDYKAYDKRMSPKEILAAFDVIIHICQLSGNYSKEDITVIRGIAEDTAFAVVDYNGDLVQLFGSNPSGNPLTVILNSIVNSLRMRYGYRLLNPAQTVIDFSDNVNLMTYGDDNIMSVHRDCDWFNHTTIANVFSKLDITYTMADKEAESIPFIHIDDASFLKRTWRKDENLGCMMAPLEHNSIEKMLTVWNRSKAVTEEYQGMAVISTALREYFFYGHDIFSEKREMLIKLIKDLGWEDWVEETTFPTYLDLCEQFKRSSRHCRSYDNYF
jgi:hypothetical protein